MRTAATTILVPLGILLPVISSVAADTSAGSGVVIGTQGEILTNSHVVEACETITVQMPSNTSITAVLVARDQKNDLAVVRIKNNPLSSVAAFREGTPIRPGDTVVALGYPLSGLLATTANLSVGNVSALAGLGDDSRYLQISSPIQPGNSGGPLLDASGRLVGIVTAKLDAARVARFTGDIPQNVNFALKAEVARTFLDSKGIAYQTLRSEQQLSPADVGDIARPFTVHIKCQKVASRTAATTPTQQPQSPRDQKPVDIYRTLPENGTQVYAATAASMISGYRTNNGLTTVSIDPELMKLAEAQAEAMARYERIDHNIIQPFNAETQSAGLPREGGGREHRRRLPHPDGSLLRLAKFSAASRQHVAGRCNPHGNCGRLCCSELEI